MYIRLRFLHSAESVKSWFPSFLFPRAVLDFVESRVRKRRKNLVGKGLRLIRDPFSDAEFGKISSMVNRIRRERGSPIPVAERSSCSSARTTKR